jgi:hypothetical protein
MRFLSSNDGGDGTARAGRWATPSGPPDENRGSGSAAARWRPQVVSYGRAAPKAVVIGPAETRREPPTTLRNRTWAALMRRAFAIDVLACPNGGAARGRHGRGPARGEPHPRRPTGALATRARRISLPPRLRTPPSVARRIPPGTVLDTARSGRAPSRSSGSGLPSSASLLGDRGNETNGRERPRCRLPPATARARGSRSIRSQPHSSGDGPRPRRCALTVKLSGRNEIGVSASKPAAGGGRQRGVRRWERGRQPLDTVTGGLIVVDGRS